MSASPAFQDRVFWRQQKRQTRLDCKPPFSTTEATPCSFGESSPCGLPNHKVRSMKSSSGKCSSLFTSFLHTAQEQRRGAECAEGVAEDRPYEEADVIISGGENLYPVQIEDFIRTNNKVHDVAVIGLKDKRLGEIAAAIIEVKEGETLTKEEVDKFCLDLPRYKRPHEVIFADIPRNPTGKIEKPKLREMYGANRLIAEQNLA